MIFNELYSSYFNAAAKILSYAVRNELTEKKLTEIIRDTTFGESILNLPQLIKGKEWQLLTSELKTPLKNPPEMPLTELEKRWLKTILQDPRIKLFGLSEEGLENTEPLYSADTFVYFDRYADGDPYNEEEYIKNFRTAFRALKEKRRLYISFVSGTGCSHSRLAMPYSMEYSAQDDKFRLRAVSKRGSWIINMARVTECKFAGRYKGELYEPRVVRESVTAELTDERNALERAMLHFSYLEKRTERISDNKYRITLYYDKEDRAEMLIRIMAFGPLLRVTEPESFVELIRERLNMQNRLRTQN
jgi:hypothetical protein